MEITLEQIDLLKKRANVSYKEAKEVLEKCNGNIVEALAYLDEEKKIKPENHCCNTTGFMQKIKNIIARINHYSLIILKDDSTVLNLPLAPVILLTLISLPLAMVALILALVTNCKIRFKKRSGEDCAINKSIDEITEKVSNFTSKVTDEIKK